MGILGGKWENPSYFPSHISRHAETNNVSVPQEMEFLSFGLGINLYQTAASMFNPNRGNCLIHPQSLSIKLERSQRFSSENLGEKKHQSIFSSELKNIVHANGVSIVRVQQ